MKMSQWSNYVGLVITMTSLVTFFAVSAMAQVDEKQASVYFAEAALLCQREGGRLWGVSLCGPMVFADPTTATIAANQTVPTSPRPRVLGYANAALEWGDQRWSTFIWQMIPVDDKAARARLMVHELFHRVQPQLDLFLPVSEGAPDHLDQLEGRYWMQLEWRALAKALDSTGLERLGAVHDALAFRKKRRSLYPTAGELERVIEINEGLAQYTATVAAVSSDKEATAGAIDQLVHAPDKESFVRTFAYPSGAAYGILLDEWWPGWTHQIEAHHDLGELVMAAAKIRVSDNAESLTRQYGGPELWVSEESREMKRKARVTKLRRRFVEGPVLILPRGRNASFITTGVTPLPGSGTIYPSFRVTGEWGSIEAEQALISPDGSQLTVPAPFSVEGSVLSGEGWTVTLEPGWVVGHGPRENDHQVLREGG